MNWGLKMDSDPKQDQAIEALFQAAKDRPAVPSADFMARLSSAADAAAPKPVPPSSTPAPSLLAGLSGLFAASGLTGAAILGVWIGFVMPETLNTLVDGFSADETISLSAFLPGADLAALSE
jgi:hypothetical protein